MYHNFKNLNWFLFYIIKNVNREEEKKDKNWKIKVKSYLKKVVATIKL